MKALGFVVSEKMFLSFSHDVPGGLAFMNPRGTVGKIYKDHHYSLLHIKYESSGPCGFREEDLFINFFFIISLWELSVAMKSRVRIRPGSKPNATFPLPH